MVSGDSQLPVADSCLPSLLTRLIIGPIRRCARPKMILFSRSSPENRKRGKVCGAYSAPDDEPPRTGCAGARLGAHLPRRARFVIPRIRGSSEFPNFFRSPRASGQSLNPGRKNERFSFSRGPTNRLDSLSYPRYTAFSCSAHRYPGEDYKGLRRPTGARTSRTRRSNSTERVDALYFPPSEWGNTKLRVREPGQFARKAYS